MGGLYQEREHHSDFLALNFLKLRNNARKQTLKVNYKSVACYLYLPEHFAFL